MTIKTQISTEKINADIDRINKIGIELEGAFIDCTRLDSNMGSFHGDCSVIGFSDFNEGNFRSGEFVSKPLSVDQIPDFILNNYPDKTNYSCGGHIHISLKSASDYMDLMDIDFYNYYLDEIKKWGESMSINPNSSFWKRLAGSEYYCTRKFIPTIQRSDARSDGNRYAHINYCYNENNRHTVEFRMLPCFQKSTLMVSATLKTIEIIENYLKNLVVPSPQKISMRIDL